MGKWTPEFLQACGCALKYHHLQWPFKKTHSRKHGICLVVAVREDQKKLPGPHTLKREKILYLVAEQKKNSEPSLFPLSVTKCSALVRSMG